MCASATCLTILRSQATNARGELVADGIIQDMVRSTECCIVFAFTGLIVFILFMQLTKRLQEDDCQNGFILVHTTQACTNPWSPLPAHLCSL